MAARPYRIFEAFEVLVVLREADATLLRTLAREVYPALQRDPTNLSGRLPIGWEPAWFMYRVELPRD